MAVVPPDYDTDPERSRIADRSWQLNGDTHEPVAERFVAEGLQRVLDMGCGRGRLGELLPAGVAWTGVDSSPAQVADCPRRPVALGDATRLPFPDGSFDAVAALWMLYHLDDPAAAVAEAHRVLRPGGLFAACTNSRTDDPELVPDGYPRSPFDAEEAPDIVASVFDRAAIEILRWDDPWTLLPDADAVRRYVRSHFLPPETADGVATPLTLTKRGCLIWARR